MRSIHHEQCEPFYSHVCPNCIDIPPVARSHDKANVVADGSAVIRSHGLS